MTPALYHFLRSEAFQKFRTRFTTAELNWLFSLPVEKL
jgi:hypothetical protein